MTREDKEEAVVETPTETKPKFTLIVILSALLGVLLTLMTGGAIYHFQSGKAVQAELAAAREEVKRKTLMLTELQEQVAGLSRQVHALREFSVAKASGVAAEVVAAEKQQASAESSPPAAPVSESGKKEPVTPPVAKKVKPAGLDCQIVGKSPEEQMATLKRCTQAMDGKK